MILNNQVYGCILVSPYKRILLVQGRSTGKWSFPKGHPIKDELPLDCAKRELFEETGLKAPFMYYNSYQLATGVYYMYNISEEYDCKTMDPDEIQNICWSTISEIQKMNVNIDVNTFLRQQRRYPFPLKGTKPIFLSTSSSGKRL